MTWPTTQIATTNLDAGSDQPKLARSDLLDTVNAVNAMIAYGDPKTMAVLTPIMPVFASGNDYWSFTEVYDPSGMITLTDSSTRFSLPAGTYLLENFGNLVDGSSVRWYGIPWWDYTLNQTLAGFSENIHGGGLIVLSGSKTLGCKSNRFTDASMSGLLYPTIKITKLA